MAEKPKSASHAASFEQALMQELRFGGIDKENLRELVGIVAEIQRGGLKGVKAFPKGVPPIVDGLRISGVVDVPDMERFLGVILTKTPRLGGVEVFPLGIPWPDVFRVNIDLGAPIETGSLSRF